MMRYFLIALATLAAVPAAADQMVGQYTAFIGQDDLYNSKGKRLTEPWQILRQDRAKYHRFGVSQPGDEWDPYFGWLCGFMAKATLGAVLKLMCSTSF